MRRAVAAALVPAAAARAEAADRRIAVDPNAPPWNAIAKVQTNTGARCTGVLIAPAVVLTAAHCLYNRRTQALLQPGSLHVLFGYERAGYRWHRLVTRLEVGARFDGGNTQPQPSDWARLELAENVPAQPLPFSGGTLTAGMPAALAGYNQDRAQLLMTDTDCHVRRMAPLPGGAAWITHDCAATRGTSGAPLLAHTDGGWSVLGINIAAGRDANLALRPALDR